MLRGSTGWSELFAFTEKELVDLESAKKVLPHASFTAEKLQNAGIDIIPVDRSDYPVVLKENLKLIRKVYVRMPEPKEKNANLKLIELGAVGVDKEGNPVKAERKRQENETPSLFG